MQRYSLGPDDNREVVLLSDHQAEIEARDNTIEELRHIHKQHEADLTQAREEIASLRLYKDCTKGLESAREKEITKLIAENKRLREALSFIANAICEDDYARCDGNLNLVASEALKEADEPKGEYEKVL